MTDREVMQQALDALENTAPFVRAAKGVQTAMAALRAAFAAPQDEPVAVVDLVGAGGSALDELDDAGVQQPGIRARRRPHGG